jgi:hypothetical protein
MIKVEVFKKTYKYDWLWKKTVLRFVRLRKFDDF